MAAAIRNTSRAPGKKHLGYTVDLGVVLGRKSADVLLVGHSHGPFLRRIGDKVLLNPGSIGQPRTGEPVANYAVWRDGRFELKSFPYPVEATVEKLRALAFPHNVEAELVNILATGSV